MITLLHIFSLSDERLILEEISAPSERASKFQGSWQKWIEEKAPGHTSWVMHEIDFENDELLESFSFSRSAWLQLNSQDFILSTLLTLPLKPVPDERRRKIGPPPPHGERDHRSFWTPPVYFEGKKTSSALAVYYTYWPKDETELSQKKIEIYFDTKTNFPFPYWIQVSSGHGTLPLQVIDSGKGLTSYYSFFPRRNPEFVKGVERLPNTLRFTLKCPKYYDEFILYAIDTSENKTILPIPFHVQREGQELVILDVHKQDLKDLFQKDHAYSWLLMPKENADHYAEIKEPFLWSY